MEEVKEKEGGVREYIVLLLMEPARVVITPRTPASVSYFTANPSLTDGHELGEKYGSKILLVAQGEIKGEAVMDGCV